jgi:hypothetical protein
MSISPFTTYNIIEELLFAQVDQEIMHLDSSFMYDFARRRASDTSTPELGTSIVIKFTSDIDLDCTWY